jgi:hypothetical protein
MAEFESEVAGDAFLWHSIVQSLSMGGEAQAERNKDGDEPERVHGFTEGI